MATQQENPCDRLLTVQQLASKLAISKRGVHRLNSSGRIPKPLQIGGAIRWSEKTINRWLDAGAPDRRTFEEMREVGR